MENDNDIQLWTVPLTGGYSIQAIGADGSNPGRYGRGRVMRSMNVTLTKGEVIKIFVGQQGTKANGSALNAGGGGGTFVVRDTKTPIIIADGGGGGLLGNGGNAISGTAFGGLSFINGGVGGIEKNYNSAYGGSCGIVPV
jgi:hypothetical protein